MHPIGSVGSESILMRIQAGRDVVSDVLENQFLEALRYREVGRQLVRYRKDGCCLEGDSYMFKMSVTTITCF